MWFPQITVPSNPKGTPDGKKNGEFPNFRHTQGATNGVPSIALHHGFGRVPRESFPESVKFSEKNTSTSQWNADHKPSLVEQNNKR